MRFTPRSIAICTVAMLSVSSDSPYAPFSPRPMQPSAIGNTSGPVAPSFVFVVMRAT
ncbi:hypothetical protein BH11MYX2_BH11MYX2_18630 [soil metagenome]